MNISDPIPISSTGSNGSIMGGADSSRQRSNNTQASSLGGAPAGPSRMDSGIGSSMPRSSSSSLANNLHYTFPGNNTGGQVVGSPSDSNGFTDSPSNLNMASLSMDPQQNVPAPVAPSSQQQQQQVVPVGFEEGTLRALCDLDCGFPLLMDRIKQSMSSCRETSIFFKKRAQIEEEYARSLQKLTRERIESYSLSDGKGGSFVGAYNALLRSHDTLADNHVKLAQQLSEMSDQLIETAREVEKQRKSAKETGTRLERNLTDSESQTDKARTRFDASVEELERILISKAGENVKDQSNMPADHHAGKRTLGKAIGKLKGGPKNPAQLQRMEEDARYKMNSLSDGYRQQVISTQTIRQEYFNLQLPRMLKTLKESLDEVDLGTQYHLSRYAYLLENVLLNDGLTVAPVPGVGGSADDPPGLKSIAESIDNREDFKKFMQNYAVSFAASGQRVLRREGPPEEGFVRMPKVPQQLNGSQAHNTSAYNSQGTSTQGMTHAQSYSQLPKAQQGQQQQTQQAPVYFGVELGEQMDRDNVDIPKVLQKCVETIETYGMDSQGLYRLSGTTSRIQRLRAKMEKDIDNLNLNSEENLTDINDITGVLKLFFRELPDPLFTLDLYHGFIEAAKIDNARLRHIRLHERINELPDPNYATCKYFLGHLDRVRQHSDKNSMSISNLAIVFGPTLLRAPSDDASSSIHDMQYQYKAIETILEHYRDIFVEAEEDPETEQTPTSAESPSLPQSSGFQHQEGTGPDLSSSPTSRTTSDNMI